MPSTDVRTARLAELQRLAYGAGGSDAERAAAASELAALRAEVGSVPTDASGDTQPADAVGATTDAASDLSADDDALVEASGAAERRAHRRLVAVGAIAAATGLLLGGLGGWQLAERAAAAAAEAAPRPGTVAALSDSDVLLPQEIPVDGTGAYRALLLDDGATTLPAMWTDDPTIDADTAHRLRAATGGIEVYGMMTSDHEDLCLLIMYTDGGAMSCTDRGVFPPLGLTLSASPSYRPDGSLAPSLEATWLANGTLRLMTPYE